MAIEAKRDLRIVIPYTVITLALFGALFTKACTWQQFLAGLALLNVPAFFGLKKKDDDDQPPGQTPVLVDDTPGATVQKMGAHKLPAIITPIVEADRGADTLPVPREPSAMPYRLPAVRPEPPKRTSGGGWSMRAALLLAVAGCASATPQEKAAAADAAFAAEQLACVQQATTLAESKACRAKVRAAWHLDGGTEAGQ